MKKFRNLKELRLEIEKLEKEGKMLEQLRKDMDHVPVKYRMDSILVGRPDLIKFFRNGE